MNETNNQKTKLSPRDFFLHLAAMVALYVSVISFITLWFEYINALFPDQLERYYTFFSGPIRYAMASLVVVFPLYIFLTRFINQDIRKHPEKGNLGLRKWLIYLALFVAGVTIAIDLVVLINTFLGGELTTRFVLKALVVFLVVGAGFIYYLYALRGRFEEDTKTPKLLAWAVSGVVLVSLAAGFFIIGTPQSQRLLRFDEQKANDLQNIQWQVVNYWQLKEKLPNELRELEDPISGFIVPIDPQTGESYIYRTKESLTFELCANFNLESSGAPGAAYERAVPTPVKTPFGPLGGTWEHGEGETCFERTIDPERLPPFEKPLR